ncbi:hypothetical protein [Capnocytophaga sp. oral taxon 878]|uniref:hypothetical protein n=1 Tax=Capnocytophaga sp. oral taxon 878 TaxID=1316596 RepID=UPI00101ADE63|nr:hypothetical protein [Capnocytophaga sp. oral taxon 878]
MPLFFYNFLCGLVLRSVGGCYCYFCVGYMGVEGCGVVLPDAIVECCVSFFDGVVLVCDGYCDGYDFEIVGYCDVDGLVYLCSVIGRGVDVAYFGV